MSERSLGEKMAIVETYKQNLANLMQQEEYVKQALESYVTARETLRNYAEAKEDGEIIVPIGGNAYLFAKAANQGMVLRGIGNDVVIEEDSESAMRNLTAQIEEMGATIQNISARIVDLERKLGKLSAEVEQEYSAMNAEGASQG